jgi:ATP-dependent RNA helicase RhlE
VHRIGRTGRAGLPGDAISLVAPDEAKLLAAIEALLKRRIPKLPLPSDFAADASHGRARDRDAHPVRESRSRSGERDAHPVRETRTRSRDRDERPQRGSARRGERDERAPRGMQRSERDHRTTTQSSGHRSKPSPASDFDFTKPYVPAASSVEKPAADVHPLPYRGRPKRPTPALLGGSPGAHKSHK